MFNQLQNLVNQLEKEDNFTIKELVMYRKTLQAIKVESLRLRKVMVELLKEKKAKKV